MNLLTMSARERRVLDVLYRLDRGELSRREAGVLIERSPRQVYRLYRGFKQRGDRAVIHGSRGGHSARGYPLSVRNEVVRLYRSSYSDYGPTLFSEMLAEQHGYRIDRETLRRWLREVGLWKPELTGRRRAAHRRARPRRAEIGAMLQLDGSVHDWFEGRNPEQPMPTLLVLIDDASNRTYLRFARVEDTASVFEAIDGYARRYGLPQALYTDFGAAYGTEPGARTEYRRALGELGIQMIQAHSPQAKGRVERANRTHQQRLVRALRRENIRTIDDANRYLDAHYTARHNRQFSHTKGLPDIHRPVDNALLDRALAIAVTRRVRNDHTVLVKTRRWQIERPERGLAVSPGATVDLRIYRDGSVHCFVGDRELPIRPVVEQLPGRIPGRRRQADVPASHMSSKWLVSAEVIASGLRPSAITSAGTGTQ